MFPVLVKLGLVIKEELMTLSENEVLRGQDLRKM